MQYGLGNSRLGSLVGRFGRNQLSNMHGDNSKLNLTPAVQALFQSNAGIMLDFTLSSSLFQDSARTTPVTASGQPVGSITDLSPNGKNASSSGGSRPLWNSLGYGTFDGFDDYLQTAAIDFTATDAVTVVVTVLKASDAASAMVMELSPSVTAPNNGAFYILCPTTAGGADFRSLSRGTAQSQANTSAIYPAPQTVVLTANMRISTDTNILNVNGIQAATSSTYQGTGNYGNYALNIGSRNTSSLLFNGRIYRLLVIGRALTTTERNTAERWAAQPVGIVIP